MAFAHKYEYKLNRMNSKVIPSYYKYINGIPNSVVSNNETDESPFYGTYKYKYGKNGNEIYRQHGKQQMFVKSESIGQIT